MKKLLMIFAVIVLPFVGFAQTNTATLTLEGTVGPQVEIGVTPESVATSLDLTTNQTDLLVAIVTERSNISAGYTVSVESANANGSGPFFDSGGSTTLPYDISYDGTTLSFSSGVANDVIDSTSITPSSGIQREVRITYSGQGVVLEQGTYSDTLTFTITAK